MRTSIDLPASFVTAARARSERSPIILAVDPGKRTGLALLDVGTRRCASTTSTNLDGVRDAVAGLMDAWSVSRPRVSIYAREAPYSVSNAALAAGRANAGALWSLGYAAGVVDAHADRWFDRERGDVARWEPQPVTWRSILGLNSGDRTRDAVNERVLAWAEATTQRSLRTPRGAKLFDEANAIALAFATVSVFIAARRTA
jgi:hypothetical protein